MDDQEIKTEVRSHYAEIARQGKSGCSSSSQSDCCSGSHSGEAGVEDATVASADLGLGCGLPTQYARIQAGNTVLDLGSGAGVDVFRAAKSVGPEGRVIGVDMTPEMIERARENAIQGGYLNVEFRQGEIEALPVEDGSVDVVLSNCVINLVPDKAKVFREMHRVLKPGGHFSISDIVTYGPVPDLIRQDMALWSGCIAGAMDRDAYLKIIENCGYRDIQIHQFLVSDFPKGKDFGIASITVEAVKG
jgi:ubiquinone/menaquinone biosynthesis C-methylase UbiE